MRSALVLAMLAIASSASAQRERNWPEEWPIVPAPVVGPLPPAPPVAQGAPATRAAQRTLELVTGLRGRVRDTSYQHSLAVDERRGVYRWDCSIFVEWVLRRSAPRTVASMRSLDRARAIHFVRAIERAPMGRFSQGWQRLPSIHEVEPGDVFAWRRPAGFPSNNTGHVGFFMSKPVRVPGIAGGWAARIADSTRSAHQDDTRPWPGNGGFGVGTLVFLTDEQGQGTHYGWAGTYSEGYVVTPILFGRIGP